MLFSKASNLTGRERGICLRPGHVLRTVPISRATNIGKKTLNLNLTIDERRIFGLRLNWIIQNNELMITCCVISCRDWVPTFEANDQEHNFASGLQKEKKTKVFELEIEVKIKLSLVIFLFHESKNSAVFEPSTGQFRGPIGFEAKNLSFEA